MDHAAARQPLGFAYGLAREAFPAEPAAARDARVRSLLLALMDEELIVIFRADPRVAFEVDLGSFPTLTREEADAELGRGHAAIDPYDGSIYLEATPGGKRACRDLPPDAFLDPRQSSSGP